MVGLLEPWERHAVSHFTAAAVSVVLLGESREELGGSAWLAERRGLERGAPPAVDLAHERRLHGLLARGVAEGLVSTAHDVAEGGLAVALAEACFTGPEPVGARVALAEGLRPDALLFGESTGRVVVASSAPEALLEAAAEAGVAARRIGETGGTRLRIENAAGNAWIDAELAPLHEVWSRALPRRLAEAGS
jgi:phosphoribosylformylglycinamidine synthase